MASETIVENSYTQDSHEADEGWENIPPQDSAGDETSEPKVQVGDVLEYSSTQPCGENQPSSRTCTFSTPAPASAKGGVRVKSRLSGLPSALTPILKYLKIGNKCQSPESTSSHSGRPLGEINAPVRFLEDEYLPEITLLDVTCDTTMQVTRNDSALPDSVPATPVTTRSVCSSFPSVQPPKLNGSTTPQPFKVNASNSSNITAQTPTVKTDDYPESAFTPLRWLDDKYFPEITLLDVTRDSEVSPGAERSSMNVTLDIPPSDAPNEASSELRGESVAEPGTLDINKTEDLSSTLEGNATHTIGSSSEQSSLNNTSTVAQPANLTSSINSSSTSQTPQNKTLDLPAIDVDVPKEQSEIKDMSVSLSGNTSENSTVPSSSALKPGGSCDAWNATFDRNSLQKSSGNSGLEEAAAATLCLQNNTFDTRPTPQQNGTITLSETSSSDSHHNTGNQTPAAKICDATSGPNHTLPEVLLSEVSKHNESTASKDPNAKMANTFEVDPVVQKTFETGQSETKSETKDPSQLGLPMADSLSDISTHLKGDLESNKASSFDLDGTLDLAADALITSTPMPNSNMFNLNSERETSKIVGVTKKLYGDAPCKPDDHVTSEIPSNIVCDRKTFLTKPAAKSLLPSLDPASNLLKYKFASTLTSGLPMTRQRTQAEALRSTATSDAPQVPAETTSSYNLRATTTGSKQPFTGLRKPQKSGLPSGIQRPAMGLRPPSARSNAPTSSSSTDKLRAPLASNPVTKISQAKKHPLNKAEALPGAKKRKVDALVPSKIAEASTSSCDAANKAKNLKQPATSQRVLPAKTHKKDAAASQPAESSTSCDAVSRARVLKQPATSHRALIVKPQAHSCANCAALEQQLKMKSEEIQRLKEELQKFHKDKEDC
ncbi:mucin-17-like [Xyrichtys novacula]|uniref:Mucin-17-like n=1 Tax=Xyrichtys novacula TaxID=13765 RepID=A0AAV1H3H0_XYRNO|nr:mucin-17-like [Xyrichtys novacula]